jgi:MoxR-like ATPase
MNIIEVEARCRAVLDALSRVIVGKDDVLRRLLAGVLANGHILIEDYPGLAKTLIARLLGEAVDLRFKRISKAPRWPVGNADHSQARAGNTPEP